MKLHKNKLLDNVQIKHTYLCFLDTFYLPDPYVNKGAMALKKLHMQDFGSQKINLFNFHGNFGLCLLLFETRHTSLVTFLQHSVHVIVAVGYLCHLDRYIFQRKLHTTFFSKANRILLK